MNSTACTALSSRNDFAHYIHVLRGLTDGDFRRASNCRRQVCGALWGTGNPDISGVGMAVGYVVESGLCAGLVLVSVYQGVKSKKKKESSGIRVPRLLLVSAADRFYDCAAFFCFAIQTASIVTLARVNFGVSAEGMGGLTLQIAWQQGVHVLSAHERNLITSFGIIGYLLLSVVIISRIIVSIADGSSDTLARWLRRFSFDFKANRRCGSYARALVEFIVTVTLVIQFWAFFCIRDIQRVMDGATEGSFADGQWTFGQIVAVLVFVPVAVEIVFVWKKQSLFRSHKT